LVFIVLVGGKTILHTDVSHPNGEAKVWLKPTIELARNIGLGSSMVFDH
jgi:hypothetical protein